MVLVYYTKKITGNTSVLPNKLIDIPPVALIEEPSRVKAVTDREDLLGLHYSASQIAEQYLDFYNEPIFISSGSGQRETQ